MIPNDDDLSLELARQLPVDALNAVLRRSLDMTAEALRRACVAITALRERGAELPDLPSVFAPHIAAPVAEGRLTPRAALMTHALDGLSRWIAQFPADLQDRLAEGERIKVAVLKAGRISYAHKDIYALTPLERRLIADSGRIGSADRMGEWLLKNGSAVIDVQARPVQVRPDVGAGVLRISRGGELRPDDLLPALAALGFVLKPIYGKPFTPPQKKRG